MTTDTDPYLVWPLVGYDQHFHSKMFRKSHDHLFFDNVFSWLKCGQHVYVSSNALGYLLCSSSHQLIVHCNIAAKEFEELTSKILHQEMKEGICVQK